MPFLSSSAIQPNESDYRKDSAGSLIKHSNPSDLPLGIRVALIGLSDLGAPDNFSVADAIRREFFRMSPHHSMVEQHRKVFQDMVDLGNASVDLAADSAGNEFVKLLQDLSNDDIVPVILGGNKQIATHALASQSFRDGKSSLVMATSQGESFGANSNLKDDGSLDIAEFSSASLFQSEHGCRHLHLLGLANQLNSPQLSESLEEFPSDFIWSDDWSSERIGEIFGSINSSLVALFDFDVLQASEANPFGVADGIMNKEFLAASVEAGRCSRTSLWGLVGIPLPSTHTANITLAATAVWNFTLGFSHRW